VLINKKTHPSQSRRALVLPAFRKLMVPDFAEAAACGGVLFVTRAVVGGWLD